MLTFPSATRPPSRAHPLQGLGEQAKVNLLPRQNSTNWLFSNLSPRFRYVTSLTSLVTSSIWDLYCDISEWHVRLTRAWTPALMLHLTNPCAKRKVLSLTKPKGNIYKTKSLGHYITNSIFLDSSYSWPCVKISEKLVRDDSQKLLFS